MMLSVPLQQWPTQRLRGLHDFWRTISAKPIEPQTVQLTAMNEPAGLLVGEAGSGFWLHRGFYAVWSLCLS